MTRKRRSVNHATLVSLRDKYQAFYEMNWPHDNDYLRVLWGEVNDTMPNNRFTQKDRYEFALTRMRECHDTTTSIDEATVAVDSTEAANPNRNGHLRIEGDQPQVLIPEGENPFGIEPGFRDVVKLLRENADKPDVIRYIADMLEL